MDNFLSRRALDTGHRGLHPLGRQILSGLGQKCLALLYFALDECPDLLGGGLAPVGIDVEQDHCGILALGQISHLGDNLGGQLRAVQRHQNFLKHALPP